MSAASSRHLAEILLLATILSACPAPINSSQNPAPPAAPQPAPPPEDFLSSATLEFPAGFMKSVKDYGAKGDGVTDDTAAIRSALGEGRVDGSGNALYPPAEFNGRPKALYFPAGTYLVSNTLRWSAAASIFKVRGQPRRSSN